MLSLLLRLLLVTVLLCAVPIQADVPADEITSLPGWTGKLPSRHYSGFFPTSLDGSPGAMLHYWLTLSESQPTTDPLVVWLQGGPGCSSLFGLLYENGQLHFSGDKDATGAPTLVQNPYAWTKVANMLWLEQPVGVGFSYCQSGNCTCDYEGCAFGVDAYGFFVNFFGAYPELAKLDFHISGESYGGVYVPFVADAVLKGNQQGGNTPVNLKGILIGNGVGGLLNATEQLRRRSDFFYGHTYSTHHSRRAGCRTFAVYSQCCRLCALMCVSGHAMFSYQQQKQIDAACDWNATSVSSGCRDAVSTAMAGVGDYYMSAQRTLHAHMLSQPPSCRRRTRVAIHRT